MTLVRTRLTPQEFFPSIPKFPIYNIEQNVFLRVKKFACSVTLNFMPICSSLFYTLSRQPNSDIFSLFFTNQISAEKDVKRSDVIEKKGELDFSTFLTMMHRQIQQEDPKAEILEAMRMTDKQKKGYILASELRAKLTKLGEKLTDKEVDELFREANVKSNGNVHYEEFTRMVTLPSVDY
uniref:Calmodulin like 4 n=2 Tax=Oncorhynchus kisutch TaxID=8019 RepID=A0A8C7JZX7_ONCKI